jgi:hypothetical protein
MMDFEGLYAELAQGAETLKALVSGVTQEQAQIKPTPEAWSILEVVCHLYDEEVNDFRPRLDVMLNRPNDVPPPNNPQEWITERRYNEQDLGEMLGKFLEEREKSLAWLRTLEGANWEAPYTTPWRVMKAGDMFVSWVTHDILHMRQLVELRYARVLTLSAPYDVDYAGGWDPR